MQPKPAPKILQKSHMPYGHILKYANREPSNPLTTCTKSRSLVGSALIRVPYYYGDLLERDPNLESNPCTASALRTNPKEPRRP